jgi:hypothetical protein
MTLMLLPPHKFPQVFVSTILVQQGIKKCERGNEDKLHEIHTEFHIGLISRLLHDAVPTACYITSNEMGRP